MGRQRVHKLHKCWAKFVQANYDRRQSFALFHHYCEEVVVFDFQRGWTKESCSQQPSLVGDWSRVLGSMQLVSHVLGAVHWKWEIVTTEQVQLDIGIRVQL